MMFYPQDIIDQVIDANNIVEVVGSYVKLTKKGSTYFGLCPFHNEKTPSFSVTDNGNKQMYYCFGCHKGGTVLTFLMKYENISYTDAVKTLAGRAGIALPEPEYSKEEAAKAKKREQILAINKEAATYFYHLLKSERGKIGLDYFRQRGLSDETIRNYGLGFSDKYRDDLYKFLKGKGFSDEDIKNSQLAVFKNNDVHDFFWNRVMFPIMDTRNRVIAFGGRVLGDGEPKYLNSLETDCFIKRCTLYGINVAKKYKGKALILCEGYMDVISLHQAGFTNAIATLGTAFTDGHARELKKYTDNIYISYDCDAAGKDATLRAIPKLRDVGIAVKVVDFSPFKDPDEMIKSKGIDAYKECLKNAKNSLIFEIECLRDSFDLSDPDDKTRFDNEVARRLSFFDDNIERENYVKVVASNFDIDYSMLKDKALKLSLSNSDIKHFEPIRQVVKKSDNNFDALGKCQKIVLSYMAKDPSLYDAVSQVIDENDFTVQPYSDIAIELFEQLRKGKINANKIINAFEDTNVQEEAADILEFRIEDELSDDEIRKAINDCIIRIKNNSIEIKLDNEENINVIIELKKEQEKLQKLNIFGREN